MIQEKVSYATERVVEYMVLNSGYGCGSLRNEIGPIAMWFKITDIAAIRTTSDKFSHV